ncbi:MAG: hypothetical protein KGM43_14025, partial [Planctomycetota bacterium]|nr:hypothetical protein [Planctomycetota bacterium]
RPGAAAPNQSTAALSEGDASILDAYRHVEVASVSDAVEKVIGKKMYMSHRMRPIFSTKFAGFALTVALKKEPNATEERKQEIRRREEKRMLEYGGFLGSWVKTAKLTFPYIYIYGTNEVPGHGLRETFVVVASKSPVDLKQLGGRDDDPQFFQHDRLFEPEPFGDDDCAQVDVRSRGIVLTDDYAPVENLLAPVAKTRGDAD